MIFKDAEGREWVIRFDYGTLCRIEDELGYKILEDPSSLPTGVRDVVKMLWLLIEKQAKEKGVSAQSFGESLQGATINSAILCMVEELAVFFEALQPGVSAAFRKWLEKRSDLASLLYQAAGTALEAKYSSMQDSLVLTPGDTPSGN